MIRNFRPKIHGDIQIVVKEAKELFPNDLLAVMRVGETAKSDVYQVVLDECPAQITNGWQRSVTVVCSPERAMEFLTALHSGIVRGERPNYWLRIWGPADVSKWGAQQ